MNKKNDVLVLGGTYDMAFAMGTCLLDFKKKSPALVDEVIIYHNGISEKDQEIMNKIFPTKFIEYKLGLDLEFDTWTINRFSELVFHKFECIKLLKEYKTVIVSDFDIVLLEDISEIKSLKNKESSCRFIINEPSDIFSFFKREVINDSDFKYQENNKTISAGLMVLHDNLENIDEMYDYCYKTMKKYSKYLLLPEQAIFTLMMYDFNLKPEKIDRDIYVVHPNDINEKVNAKILHAFGIDKFWDNIYNKDWNENYKTWLEMGGSDKSEIDLKLKIKNERDRRNKIINKIAWFIPNRRLRDNFRDKFLEREI